jgi:hypothetical protein
MSEHIDSRALSGFRSHRLPADEVLSVARHLRTCAECRGRLSQPGDAWVLGEALTEESDEHLSEGDIDAAVDGAVGTEMQSHLGECAACAAQVDDLRRFAGRKSAPRYWRIAAAIVLPLLGAGAIAFTVMRDSASPKAVPIAATRPQTVVPAAVASLRDGKQTITLRADGTIDGRAFRSESDAQLTREALRDGVVPRNATVAALAPVAGVLRGPEGQSKLTVLEPVGTAVAEARPAFRWSEAAGAASYRVQVFTDGFELVAESARLRETSWRPVRDLQRGRVYRWQVVATVNGAEVFAPGRQGEARFRVLSADEEGALRESLASYADSPLLRGLLYARNGLLHDAERELNRVAADNPQSDLAQKLAARVR